MNFELYRGDCLDVMKDIPDGSVDLILTDPPYGTTACKWDSIIPLEPMWEQLKRIIKPNGAIVMTAAQPFTSIIGASNVDMLRYSWVWEKSAATGHLNAKKIPMKNHEDVLVFYGRQPTYNPQGIQKFGKVTRRGGNGGCYGDSGRENLQEFTNYPRTIQKFASESKTVHPTQKPVALMEYLIKTYTNEGETVLDFTMGSGTTGEACANTGRKFIGIELDRDYYHIARKRIAEAYKTKAP
ncbi:MAG: DNA-methyltransferase [Trichlorobacter sp.]